MHSSAAAALSPLLPAATMTSSIAATTGRGGLSGDVGANPEFLYDDCGRNALKLAAKGHTIIAELLRLSEHIPLPFVSPDRTEYGSLIFDFNYFRQREVLDQVIADSPELSRLDEEFWQTHMDLLDRFFKLFRSVFLYVTELNRFVDEIRDGVYVSQTIDGIINGSLDGVQLLSELHHLYGVMLLLLDEKIGGKTREHLLVSYIRYRGAGEPHVVGVTNLCRSTGYEPAELQSTTSALVSPAGVGSSTDVNRESRSKVDAGYPAAYFARLPVRGDLVRKLIDRLRAEDIYRMGVNYPLPEHRGVALASQGALLYTLLFFHPVVLAEEAPVMGEIVNKHFHDSWIINYYLGFTVDLTKAWRSFPAARQAIARTVSLDNVVYHQQHVRAALHHSSAALTEVLRDGTLTEAYVLDNIFVKLLPLLREANTSLRWVILHGTRGHRPGQGFPDALAATYRAVRDGITDDDIIALLLKAAQLEFDLRALFVELLSHKKSKWRLARKKAAERTRKLAEYFAGEDVLTHPNASPELSRWFAEVTDKIRSLQYYRLHDSNGGSEHRPRGDGSGRDEGDPAAVARRRLQKLIKALENVLEFSQVNSSLQVVQYVQDTHQLLETMIRYANIERRVLATIATIADFSYAWEQMSVHGFFVKDIQEKIKSKPALSVQMRSVFVKMASLVDLPCNRIDQACELCPGAALAKPAITRDKPRSKKSTNGNGLRTCDSRLLAALEATSTYYSNSIVAFIRRVLHVIPTAIFETLRKVMQLLVTDEVLKECPSKIARQDMKTMSQLPVRERLSTYTADIARYAHGILAMESMRVGVTQVDSHQLLEDGIRRELVDQVARELHVGVRFDKQKRTTPADLEAELHRLGQRLSGIRTSFEYIQDYINVHGLRIWLEEFARIVFFNVDMEANAFVSRKIYPWNSSFQSESTPIPYFTEASGSSGGSTDATAPTAGGGDQRLLHQSVGTPQREHAASGVGLRRSLQSLALVDSRNAYGFLGHLVQHLLALTDPAQATYLSSIGSWYSRTTLTEVVGLRTFSSIGAALGPAGLRALDRLLCFIIAKDLHVILSAIRRAVHAPLPERNTSADGTGQSVPGASTQAPPTSTVSGASVMDILFDVATQLCSPDTGASCRRSSMAAYRQLNKALLVSFSAVTEVLVRIGRLQLMRKMLTNELRSCGKLGSGCLFTALRVANDAVLSELSCPPSCGQDDVTRRSEKTRLSSHRKLDLAAAEERANVASMFLVATELSPYLDAVGITDVLHQVFIVPAQQPPIPFFVLYLLGLVLCDASQIFYDNRFSCCTPARVTDVIDPASFVAGLALLLRQFHVSISDGLVTCLGQSMRTAMSLFSEQQDAAVLGGSTDAVGNPTQPPSSSSSSPQQQTPGAGSAEAVPLGVETLAHVLQLLFQYLDRPLQELQELVPATLIGDCGALGGQTRQKPK